MGFSLFPRDQKFFNLFQKQHGLLRQATEALNKAFKEFPDLAAPCRSIHELEQHAEDVFHEIIRELSRSFITPLDREDIHEINVTEEAVMKSVSSISTRLGLYKPVEMRKAAIELADNFGRIIGETSQMLVHMNENRGVEAEIRNIRELKRESDLFILVDLGEIYERHERDPAAVFESMKWDQIYSRMEEGIEKAVYLAHVIEGVCIKNG